MRQRIKRWLSNPRLDVTRLCDDWIKWVWRNYEGRRAVLLVDGTKLGERFGVMMVSLAYQQRAIPLLWRCYYANNAEEYPQQGQVLLILGQLHLNLPLPADTQKRVPTIHLDLVGTAFLPSVMLQNLDAIALLLIYGLLAHVLSALPIPAPRCGR